MISEYVYNHFIVLYQTDTRSKERADEIVLLSLSELSGRGLERIEADNYYRARRGENIIEIPPTKLLKIREAPRRFSKYNLINSELVRVFYWSNGLGAHVMKPFWKEKDGVLTMDNDDTVAQARIQAAEEGRLFENDELNDFLNEINHLNIRYHFEKAGYYNNADAYGGDWARSELSVHFNENSFHVDDLKVSKLMITSHWEVEEAWKKAESMLNEQQWSMQKLAELIKMLDTYDTHFRLTYTDNESVYTKNIRMNGGKISQYEEEGWAPEIIAVIDGFNEEYRQKLAEAKNGSRT